MIDSGLTGWSISEKWKDFVKGFLRLKLLVLGILVIEF
jgi:hypothetical protein